MAENRPSLSEVHWSEPLPHPADKAYILAIAGDYSLASELVGPDRQAVLTAGQRYGHPVPEDLGKAGVLPASVIADSLRYDPSIPMVEMAIARLGGERTAASKRAKQTASVLGAVVIIPEVASAAADQVLRVTGLHRTRRVLDVATAALSVPKLAADAASERGMHELIAVARNLVHYESGDSYHKEEDLIPWLWVAIMRRAVTFPDIKAEALMVMRGRLFESLSAPAPRSGRQAVSHVAEPLAIFCSHLVQGATIPQALRGLDQARNREAAQAEPENNEPMVYRRPSGETMQFLVAQSKEYQTDINLPYANIHAIAQEAAHDTASSRGVERLARITSIVLERAQIPDDPARVQFAHLSQELRTGYGEHLARYIRSGMYTIAAQESAVGFLRVADSMVRHPDAWKNGLTPEHRHDVGNAITQAAFEWFGLNVKDYSHLPDVVRIIGTAYVQAVTELDGLTRNVAVAKLRANTLLAGLPNDVKRSRWVESALPAEVKARVAYARNVQQYRSSKKRR